MAKGCPEGEARHDTGAWWSYRVLAQSLYRLLVKTIPVLDMQDQTRTRASHCRTLRPVLLLAPLLASAGVGAQPAGGEPALPSLPVQTLVAPEPARAADAEVSAVLQDVVVTAQKKKQSLQKVPVSVGVVSADTLEQSGTFDASGLENFIANVEIDTDPQAPVIGVRGFYTETDNVGFESSVGLVFDELALGRPEFVPDGQFDLDRVEVLRGTQGTLFGKNTIAGVINFLTAEPTAEPAAEATLSAGAPLQRRLEAMFNLPLGEDYAGRVAAVNWLKNGDVYNSTQDRTEGRFEQTAGRLKLLARPSEAWRLSLSSQISDTAVVYAPWQLYDASPDALRYAQSFDASTEDDPLDAHTAFNLPGFVERDSDVSRALLVYEPAVAPWGLKDFGVTAVVGHAGFDFDALIDIDVSAADLITTSFRVGYQQDSAELRAAFTAGSLFGLGREVDGVIGLYGFRSRLRSDFDTLAGEDLINFALSNAGLQALGVPTFAQLGPILEQIPNLAVPIDDGVTRDFLQRSDSQALFGQVTWNFTERFALLTGLRLGQDEKTADFDTRQVGPGLVSTVVGAEPFQTRRERQESDLSPKLGLQAQWTPELLNYLSWTRGFKGGGFNAIADTDEQLEFDSERAQSVELGLKSRWLGRSLTLNAAFYRTDIQNLQVADFTGFSFVFDNAAEARLQGFELEARWRPRQARWFEFNASAALSEAKYRSYPNAPPSQASGGDSQDLSGRTLANAPRATLSASPVLILPLPFASDLSLAWAVDVSFRGEQYSATDLDPHSREKAYTLLGSRLVLAPGHRRWAVVASGANLTDERALDLVFDHSVYQDSFIAQQIPLRSFVLSFQAAWK